MEFGKKRSKALHVNIIHFGFSLLQSLIHCYVAFFLITGVHNQTKVCSLCLFKHCTNRDERAMVVWDVEWHANRRVLVCCLAA